MRTYILAILLALGMATPAFAGGITGAADSSTTFRITATVYNDSGSDLTSGSVVIWDNDDTEFDRTGYPYVTTTTTADHDWVAGVVLSDSIPTGSVGEIVVYGWAETLIAHTTDPVAEDTTVATSTVAGSAGDWAATANTCYLGVVAELYNLSLGSTTIGGDNTVMPVFVNPGCED